MVNGHGGATATGLEPKVAGALAYVFGWISGIIFLLIEPNNKFVRFHALQSIFFNIGITFIYVVLGVVFQFFRLVPVLGTIFGFFGSLIYTLLLIAAFILWLVLIVRAFQGEKYKLPIVGDLAEENS